MARRFGSRTSLRMRSRPGVQMELRPLDTVPLGDNAPPNRVEFVENNRGKVVHVSLARVDDGGPGNVASIHIAVIDRSGAAGGRKVVSQFFRWTEKRTGFGQTRRARVFNVAHEQGELPNTPNAGQTVSVH